MEGGARALGKIGRFPCGRDGAGDLPSLAGTSSGQGKEGTHAGKEREDGMWPADERDPQAVREKSEARAAAKAERVRAADAERALQRGAGRAAVRGRPKRLQRRAGHAKQAGRREREGQLGRGQEEERGKGPANSWAGLKREEGRLFFSKPNSFLFLVFKSKFKCNTKCKFK